MAGFFSAHAYRRVFDVEANVHDLDGGVMVCLDRRGM